LKLFLLDTNTVSHIIRNDSASVRRNYVRYQPHQIAISAITEGELMYGLAKKPEATRLHEKIRTFLQLVQTLSWTSEVASYYGNLRQKSEAKGITCGNIDLLIAAHAYATRRILVSSDNSMHRLTSWIEIENWDC
jgi:tRNA(fMet)-specific endonuclease VapC